METAAGSNKKRGDIGREEGNDIPSKWGGAENKDRDVRPHSQSSYQMACIYNGIRQSNTCTCIGVLVEPERDRMTCEVLLVALKITQRTRKIMFSFLFVLQVLSVFCLQERLQT